MSIRSLRPFAAPTSLALLALTPAAQQQGPASALASGLSLRNAAGVYDEARLNPPGSSTPASVATAFAVPVGAPDYSLGAMFPDPNLAALVQIDASCSGNAIIPGRLGVGIDPDLATGWRWMEVTVSYAPPPAGQGRAGYYPPLLVNRPQPQSDVLGVFVRSSNGIDPSLLGGRVLTEQGAGSMGFTNGEDVDGLDFGVGVRTFGAANAPQGLFENANEYYFSLAPACLPYVNAIAGQTGGFASNAAAADAAAIYRIQWTGTGWTQPEEWVSASALGLDPAAGDDVDGLSFDPGTLNLVFSTNVVVGRSQLQYATWDDLALEYTVTDLGNGAGGTVASDLGGNDETTDIDAVCIVEPREFEYASHYGTAVDEPELSTGAVGLSVTRVDAANGEELLLEATWLEDVAGLVLFLGQEVLPGESMDARSWTVLGYAPASQPATELRLAVPPLSPGAAHIGFQAVLTDFQVRPLDQSWPLIVWL